MTAKFCDCYELSNQLREVLNTLKTYIMSKKTYNKIDSSASDIPKNEWVDRFIPKIFRPYVRLARLDRPIGTWLLLFPCWWSITIAWPNRNVFEEIIYLMAVFGIGAIVMRGAGCTYNDIMDRDFDAKVARTKDRPLPSGQLNVVKAILFLITLLFFSSLILLTFNSFANSNSSLPSFLAFLRSFARSEPSISPSPSTTSMMRQLPSISQEAFTSMKTIPVVSLVT